MEQRIQHLAVCTIGTAGERRVNKGTAAGISQMEEKRREQRELIR